MTLYLRQWEGNDSEKDARWPFALGLASLQKKKDERQELVRGNMFPFYIELFFEIVHTLKHHKGLQMNVISCCQKNYIIDIYFYKHVSGSVLC